MASLVFATKSKSSQENEHILISEDWVITLIKLLLELLESSDVSTSPSAEDQQEIEQIFYALRSIIKLHLACMTDNALNMYISLNDAVTALKEISIDRKDIWKPHTEEMKTSTLLAHTTFARRFQRRERNKRQREKFRPHRHQNRV